MIDISLPDFEFPTLEAGWVWLAGAGPGDPGLLSLHALNGLKQADVIVYDALVDARILALADKTTEVIYAGKRGGKPSAKQSDISLTLIQLAKSGKRVLRLKGGDPFVFGRGGEEALALVDAGIPFRIIPGVTAGVGGLAYAGIPATHRGINQAVTFLTGHDQNGVTPDELDWDALAKGSPVIVMYMAMKHISLISQKLMDGGRHPSERAAVICNATLQDQTVLETTLGSCAADITNSGLKPPAIVVVGEVVSLRDQMNWLEPVLSQSSRAPRMEEEPAL
ncbi:Uroporphyrinogen-III C-methyltransferase [Pseudovibrio axinellae]|uniref:uroporphyrinogen-III C-methyltransferase n=1 Tax=Pseudovibrio axinellae TaxID=989403 RepID=A0A165YVA6_9HYPH|nr:uroporphyrinogen-III C-methyltransferase [Pseudovibrio axinellae]KZL19266.1 Uroporphyrinogen-III C-methyltransferase [Pseudovibrio axinellae]SEQ43591.1 uroporphyrinogen-III C-methyltransferase [Pseudovibrio axinellae]